MEPELQKTCRPCRPVGANFSWLVLIFGQTTQKLLVAKVLPAPVLETPVIVAPVLTAPVLPLPVLLALVLAIFVLFFAGSNGATITSA